MYLHGPLVFILNATTSLCQTYEGFAFFLFFGKIQHKHIFYLLSGGVFIFIISLERLSQQYDHF